MQMTTDHYTDTKLTTDSLTTNDYRQITTRSWIYRWPQTDWMQITTNWIQIPNSLTTNGYRQDHYKLNTNWLIWLQKHYKLNEWIYRWPLQIEYKCQIDYKKKRNTLQVDLVTDWMQMTTNHHKLNANWQQVQVYYSLPLTDLQVTLDWSLPWTSCIHF